MRTNNPLHLNTLKEAAINKFFLSVTMLFALTACVTREFPPRIPEGILPGLTLLTPGVNASYRHPSWSPDGQLLVYDHANLFVPGGRDPFPYNAEIYILDLSTGHTQQLTDNEVADVQPEWSPDGSQIVFVRSKDDMNTFGGGPQRLMLISPHGSGEKLLFECPQGCEEPTWSPDNQWVIFAMEDHLWIIRVDGTDLYPITSQLAEIGDPTWSPDGNRLAYRAVDEETGLVELDLRTGDERLIVPRVYPVRPRWSPDGDTILYTDISTDDPETMYVVNIGEGIPQRLLSQTFEFDIFDATWSRDGTKIAFAYGSPLNASHLYILDLTQLTR